MEVPFHHNQENHRHNRARYISLSKSNRTLRREEKARLLEYYTREANRLSAFTNQMESRARQAELEGNTADRNMYLASAAGSRQQREQLLAKCAQVQAMK
jgi:hypothetical protein